MARSVLEIYDAMVIEKQTMATLNSLQPTIDDSQTLLNDLTSSSKVAIWRLIFFVISVGIWMQETLFDKHVALINAKAEELIVATPRWYISEAFKFQYGYTLQWIDLQYQYSQIDAMAQIIKRAAIVEANNQLRIKLAKENGQGQPIPLTNSELLAFAAYIDDIKIAGTNILCTSGSADKLKVFFKVYYDPLVLNSSGELLSTPGTFPAENAITDYIANLPFNGTLNLTELTDAVQMADGVADPILQSAEATYGNLPYQPITDNYVADAGYLEIDTNFPLSTTLTYLPANV